MKYYEYTLYIKPYSEDAADVLSALLAEEGFETFVTEKDEEEQEVLRAYVQQALCDADAIDEMIQCFPFPDVEVCYSVLEPEDKDWNEEWEKEGFEPITIDKEILICDTHHAAQFADDDFKHRILIHPRQAFGTGSHETTRMILRQLLELDLKDKRVIDAGCGTGILGLLCLQLEAKSVFAYDIDEWSTRNTADNAELNFPLDEQGVVTGERLQIELGDASCLDGKKDYDLLIANINRNILLGDIPRFSKALAAKNVKLLLSGFYLSDVPSLLDCAAQYGFHLEQENHDGDWTMLLLGR